MTTQLAYATIPFSSTSKKNRDHSPCNVLLIHATGRAAAAAKSKSHPLFKAWNMQGHASTRILRQLLVSAFLDLFFRRCLGICCRAYMQSVAPVVSRPPVVSDIALGSRAVRERDCERYVKAGWLACCICTASTRCFRLPCLPSFLHVSACGHQWRGREGQLRWRGGRGWRENHSSLPLHAPSLHCLPARLFQARGLEYQKH